MILLEEVIQLHKILIREFGGGVGVRDQQALEPAMARPFQTFDGNSLYPSVLEQAAALVESILVNHPFVDGNKRTGYAVLRLYLLFHKLDIQAPQDEKYEFIINIASGTLKFEGILGWLEAKARKV